MIYKIIEEVLDEMVGKDYKIPIYINESDWRGSWSSSLVEKMARSIYLKNPSDRRQRLIELASFCLASIESIDINNSNPEHNEL